MENLKIELLGNIPVEQVHQAFVEAFSDYEVPIQMPFEKFKEMMKTRNLNLDYSLGCFVGSRLVGFILCGFRESDNLKVCYDGGTGVIKEFRRKGIGEQLLKNLLELLKEKQISRFILEVLENNEPAIALYEKYGFRKTRKLECFEVETNSAYFGKTGNFILNSGLSEYYKLNNSEFELYKPSWQNSISSIKNNIENYTFLSIEKNYMVVCYGFVHKTRGDIPQIGILKEWRNRGLEEQLIGSLALFTGSEKITILNVEENNYLGELLRKTGFKNFVNQWEMSLEL